MAFFLKDNQAERGFSLLAVVVSLAIASFFLFNVASAVRHLFRMGNHIDVEMDVAQLRIQVLRQISCEYTVQTRPAGCDDPRNPTIDLIDHRMQPFIIRTDGVHFTVLSNYYLKASCDGCDPLLVQQGMCPASGRMIRVAYSRRYNAGEAMSDPLNANEAAWMDLFSGIPLGCMVPPINSQLASSTPPVLSPPDPLSPSPIPYPDPFARPSIPSTDPSDIPRWPGSPPRERSELVAP